MFNIGEQVEVLDEAISGTITRITSKEIFIHTKDGFDLSFAPSEIIKTTENKELTNRMLLLNQESLEKNKIHKKKIKPLKKKQKNIPPMEIDLHIHQLTNHHKSMSKHQMLTLQIEVARQKLEYAINTHIQRVIFIHGVGQGVLRMELEYLFDRYPNVEYYDAQYAKYGTGATEVYIRQKR